MITAMKENDHICDTCKHRLYCPQAWSFDQQDLDDIDQDTCGNYENEVELTEGEKADVAGDMEAHRRMVEGDEIE